MSERVAKKRMQQRRGDAGTLASLNPILKDGELGYDRTNKILKVGDGATGWNGLKEIGNGIPEAPDDGKGYLRKNRAWHNVEAFINSTTPLPNPALEEVNKQGETQVNFFVPFKYAMYETRTVLDSVAHLSWRFPFAEGRIKKISIKAKTPGNTKINVYIDGAAALESEQTATNAWKDYECNVLIRKDQSVELSTTQNFDAEDLHVSLTIQVGNASIEFVGEPDLRPNVYAWGSYARTWSNNSQLAVHLPRAIYMPSVFALTGVGYAGWAAQAEDKKRYVCGTHNFALKGVVPNAPNRYNTPIEYPVDGVADMKSSTDSAQRFLRLHEDGTVWVQRNNDTPTILKDGGTPVVGEKLCGESENAPCVLANGGTVLYIPTSGEPGKLAMPEGKSAKKALGYFGNGGNFTYCVLTTDNELWELGTGKTPKPIPFSYGAIKDIFGNYSPRLFVLTEENDVYAMGNSQFGQLGLSPTGGSNGSTKYTEFTKVGRFDVKKIDLYSEDTFLLTHGGELFHAGRGFEMFNPPIQHNSFVRVLENFSFSDIVVCSRTVVAIGRKLGEMP